jgi:hypothetical protein
VALYVFYRLSDSRWPSAYLPFTIFMLPFYMYIDWRWYFIYLAIISQKLIFCIVYFVLYCVFYRRWNRRWNFKYFNADLTDSGTSFTFTSMRLTLVLSLNMIDTWTLCTSPPVGWKLELCIFSCWQHGHEMCSEI